MPFAASLGSLSLSSPLLGSVARPPGAPPSSAPLLEVLRSSSAAVFCPPATADPRKGHPLPRVASAGPGSSVHCEGCPNSGLDFYLDQHVIAKLASHKPYIITLAILDSTTSLTASIALAVRAASTDGVSAVELDCTTNLDRGSRHPVLAFDLTALASLCKELRGLSLNNTAIGLRLPLYVDRDERVRVGQLINECLPKSGFVTIVGTMLGLVVDCELEQPVLKPAGVSG